MWPWLRKLVGKGGSAAPAPPTPPAPRHAIRARYDNAQSTDDNARSWQMVDYLSAKSANSFQVRRQLRLRSRYEVSNNPYLFGISSNNADDLVGKKGPTIKVATASPGYNRLVESAWRDWCAEVGLAEKLRTVKLARTIDGEGFLILKTVSDMENPVKLYPCDVEADQVTTPAPRNLAELWVDGLVLHPVTGRPVTYHVLKHHPGDYYFPDFSPLAVEEVRARHIVHWFPKFRPGQVRGVPIFTPSLDLFSELRSFRKAVLQKVQVAANLTAVLETEAPADISGIDEGTVSANTATEPFDALAIDRGLMATLPWGAKLHQFEAPVDATTYEMFQEKCLGEAIRPLNYPLNLALGTSQKFNFSSAKLDHTNYRESLQVERADCETVVLEPLFRAWFAEAVLAGVLPAGSTLAGTPHEWHWPGFPTLDATADTQADIAQLAAGTLTWREFWATRGYDWREVMRQQAAEKAEIEQLGLSFGEPMRKTERINEDDSEQAEASGGQPISAGYDPDQPREDNGQFGEGTGGDAQGKADAATEKARAKEDAALDLAREKEDSKIDSARDREDDRLVTQHEKEDDRLSSARGREDDRFEREQDRQREDAYDALATAADKNGDSKEKYAADHKALAEKLNREREQASAEYYAEKEAEREKQDRELATKREAEDSDSDSRRKALDGELATKREAQDEEISRRREAEDNARSAAREEQDVSIAARRLKEDDEERGPDWVATGDRDEKPVDGEDAPDEGWDDFSHKQVAGILHRAAGAVEGGDYEATCTATNAALHAIYPRAERYQGTYDGADHEWAKVGQRWIDVTASQFGGPAVLVTRELPSEYEGEQTDWTKLGPVEEKKATAILRTALHYRNIQEPGSA